MDHPNIAKVLVVGLTDARRPFFMMEYVKGVPITEYCDTVPERLQLFTQVCQAAQHAQWNYSRLPTSAIRESAAACTNCRRSGRKRPLLSASAQLHRGCLVEIFESGGDAAGFTASNHSRRGHAPMTGNTERARALVVSISLLCGLGVGNAAVIGSALPTLATAPIAVAFPGPGGLV
jgi:hypothetical protein